MYIQGCVSSWEVFNDTNFQKVCSISNRLVIIKKKKKKEKHQSSDITCWSAQYEQPLDGC